MPTPGTRRQPRSVPRQPRPKRSYSSHQTLAPAPRRTRPAGHTVLGIVLLVVAVALVPTHLAEHSGSLDPLPGNLEDVFLGFPMAGLLGISAFIALIWR